MALRPEWRSDPNGAPTRMALRLLLADAVLYQIYPSEYVDVVRDITEARQDGNQAIADHDLTFLRSLLGRYYKK